MLLGQARFSFNSGGSSQLEGPLETAREIRVTLGRGSLFLAADVHRGGTVLDVCQRCWEAMTRGGNAAPSTSGRPERKQCVSADSSSAGANRASGRIWATVGAKRSFSRLLQTEGNGDKTPPHPPLPPSRRSGRHHVHLSVGYRTSAPRQRRRSIYKRKFLITCNSDWRKSSFATIWSVLPHEWKVPWLSADRRDPLDIQRHPDTAQKWR